jgi:hypothetical protein
VINTDTINYDTAKLDKQYPAICKSRWNARKNIGDDAYFQSIGLSRNDPPELWQFALGRSEPLSNAEHYKRSRTIIGRRTLRETILALANRIEDDALLKKHLATLLKLSESEPLTVANYKLNRADSDKTKRILIEHWIQEPRGEDWLKAGRDHAQLVASKLHGVAKFVRILELPDTNGKPVKDAHDFFTAGGDAGQIGELVDATPEWTQPNAPDLRDTKPIKPMLEFFTPSELSAFTPPVGFNLVGDYHIQKAAPFVIGGAPGVGKSRGAVTLAVVGATGGELQHFVGYVPVAERSVRRRKKAGVYHARSVLPDGDAAARRPYYSN